MRIGTQESTAGGLARAFERAQAVGAESLQIFTKSGRQWAARPLVADETRDFRAAAQRTGLLVLAHASYLLNLAAAGAELWEKSALSFVVELERCAALGIPWLVVHPGSNPDVAQGLDLAARSVRRALDATAGSPAGVLFETTAGQGSSLGHSFEELAELLEKTAEPARSGVCLDSCHLFAAGYDLSSEEGYDRTMRELDQRIGSKAVRALHLNDAKKGLSSRVDRHARIGEGTLGLAAFERLVCDQRFEGLPAVLETPPGQRQEELAVLKALRDPANRARARCSASKPLARPRPAAVAKPTKSPHSNLIAPNAARG